ncbi:MAG: di-trans,poly-cis-decaprenylcistransferase [Prevotellaceae bacterium]|jgi:undecaprenyl diphosphate synthase|nr:di-trans,poly-cis-decaprenylcistransferase [Prevotellaceae bacterium]
MTTPTHVSIIMDGNGRWAQLRGEERLFGHQAGAQSVRDVVEAAAEAGVRYLSLFAFSSENWNRPKKEVDGLMELLIESIREETPNLIKNNVRLRSIGDLSHLPPYVGDSFKHSMKETELCTGLTVVLALSYSGTWDILQAANRYAKDRLDGNVHTPLDVALFEQYLSTAEIPPPDLLIRTSGEERISNFMLWQLAYTELYFTPVLWPDFRKKDLKKALAAYARRDRRFGIIK